MSGASAFEGSPPLAPAIPNEEVHFLGEGLANNLNGLIRLGGVSLAIMVVLGGGLSSFVETSLSSNRFC